MRTSQISRDFTRTLIDRIRCVVRPPATAALATMTFCSAGAQGVSIGDATVQEGIAGTATLDVPLTRTGATGQNIGLSYRTNEGGTPSATAGTDHEEIESAAAVLPAGETMLDLPGSINGDTDVEPDEQFFLHLLSATDAWPTLDFSTASPFAAGSSPNSNAVGDFNGDGRPVVATANDAGVKVFICVRHPSAATFHTGMNTVLTVEGVPDTFTTVTAPNDVVALLGESNKAIAGAVGTLLGSPGGPFGP